MICFKTARRDHSSSIIQLKICQDRLRTGQLQDLPRQAAARFRFERVCLCLEWSVSQDAQSTWELFQNLSDRLRGMPLCERTCSSDLLPLCFLCLGCLILDSGIVLLLVGAGTRTLRCVGQAFSVADWLSSCLTACCLAGWPTFSCLVFLRAN